MPALLHKLVDGGEGDTLPPELHRPAELLRKESQHAKTVAFLKTEADGSIVTGNDLVVIKSAQLLG